MLKRAKVGYELHSPKISHLLYLDDLKVFAKKEKDMNVCREIVTGLSLDIEISFGLNKCVVIHTVKGKVVRSPFIHDIPQLSGEDSYE